MLSTKQKIGWTVISIAVLVYALFPVLSILMTSFKSSSDLNSGKFIPTKFVTSNYEQIFVGEAKDLFLPALWNSIGISLISTFVAVVLATL